MWVRLKTFLTTRGTTENPRQYVMNTISRWHLSELVAGRPTVILGDFNQTAEKLSSWQQHHDLTRAHHNLHQIAQHFPPRPLCTYERTNARTHIDHIFHSHLGQLQLTQIGATDHPHISEKTDHYPLWIGLLWPESLPSNPIPPISDPIVNRPDIPGDDSSKVQTYSSQLEAYVTSLSLDPHLISSLTPEQASQYQAAIMSTSSKLAQQSTSKPPRKRPLGRGKRFKDGFSPDFRLLQLALHAYINLQRLLAPLANVVGGNFDDSGRHGAQLSINTTPTYTSRATRTLLFTLSTSKILHYTPVHR
jgi:hypothetical protein